MVNDANFHSPETCYGVSALQPKWEYRVATGALVAHAIHLWLIDIAPLSATPYAALLSAAESAKSAKYRDRAQRARYCGGRIGLRLLLSAYSGLANDELRFAQGHRGKPSLLNEFPSGELCFNYTVSGDKALYALAWNRQLGIDLERFPRKINAPLLAKRKLAAAEQQAWCNVAAHWQEPAMLASWTRKEAYGKALGVGVRYFMNQVPMFVDLNSPFWQCRVSGLFDEQSTASTKQPSKSPAKILYGVQILPPFLGIAALVHDGNALAASPTSGDSNALQAWQWKPTIPATSLH